MCAAVLLLLLCDERRLFVGPVVKAELINVQ
jgi:hypothetical protein